MARIMGARRIGAAAVSVSLSIMHAVNPTVAQASDIQVLSAVALRPLFKELAPRFEAESGHKVVTKFFTGPVVRREIDAGTAFDIAITNPLIVDSLVNEGKIVAGSPVYFARAGVGVCGRVGAPKARHQFGRRTQTRILERKLRIVLGRGNQRRIFLGPA